MALVGGGGLRLMRMRLGLGWQPGTKPKYILVSIGYGIYRVGTQHSTGPLLANRSRFAVELESLFFYI